MYSYLLKSITCILLARVGVLQVIAGGRPSLDANLLLTQICFGIPMLVKVI